MELEESTYLTSHSRMSGSRWVIIPSWLSGSWRSFLYSSSVYSRHLFLISSASVRSIPFLSFIEPIFAWNGVDLSLGFLFCYTVFVPLPYCLDDCSFVVEPEVRQVDSSNSMFLSQDCFGYLRFFVLPYKLYHWYFKFILFFNLVLSPSLSFLVSWLIMSFVFFTFFVDLFFILLECIFHWHFLKLGGKNIFSNWMSQISFFLQV